MTDLNAADRCAEPISIAGVLIYACPVLAMSFMSTRCHTYYVNYGTVVLQIPTSPSSQ